MHEFSVTKEIVSEVKKIAKEKNASSVNEIRLEVGKLSHLNISQLRFCFNSLIDTEELLRDVDLVIEEKEVFINCECGYSGEVGEEDKKISALAAKLKCPSCGNLSPSIKSGEEILIRDIKIVRDEDE